MYQDLGYEKVITDFKNLIDSAKDYNETLDTEFIKYKLLIVSGNN